MLEESEVHSNNDAAVGELAPAHHGSANSYPNGFTRRQLAAAISSRTQELIILPTEKCNFRCTYCYEDFKIGRMTPTIQRSIELFIDKRLDGLEKLNLSWFGGEPLLAKDVLLRIARYAKQRCDEHGVTLTGGLTTNGYLLTPNLATELVGLHQDFFQITLDGWEEAHNAVRRRADGRGTFSVIWENMLGMKALPLKFEVCVRIHVRRENIENLEVLMAEFAKNFDGDKRFYLDFQHLRDMGGEGGKTINDPVGLNELYAIERRLRDSYRRALAEKHGITIKEAPARTEELPSPTVLEKAANAGESAGSQRASEQFKGEPYICYAGKPNSLLIRANGSIGKCTVALDDARNDVGKLLSDGSVELNNEKLSKWFHGIGEFNVATAGCPITAIERQEVVSPIHFSPRTKTQSSVSA